MAGLFDSDRRSNRNGALMGSSPIGEYLAQLASALGSSATDRSQLEFCDHLELAAHKHVEAGLPRAEAERAAVAAFGPPEEIAARFIEEGGPMRSQRFGRQAVLIGAVLALPGLMFVVSNILKYNLGSGTLYDGSFGTIFALGFGELNAAVNAVVILGPVTALALIMWSSVDLGFHRDGEVVNATFSIRVNKLALLVAVVSVVVLGAMFTYLLFENAPCWFGGRVEC